MDKVNIILDVPVLKTSYEMQVPAYVQIDLLLPLLVRVVVGMSENAYQSSGQEFLCSSIHKGILADDKILEAYHIRNGDHLMLI